MWTCNCSNSILGFGNKKELTRWKIVLANAYGSIWSNLILPYHQNHNYARFNNSHSKLKVKTFKGAIEWIKMTMALKTWALQKEELKIISKGHNILQDWCFRSQNLNLLPHYFDNLHYHTKSIKIFILYACYEIHPE